MASGALPDGLALSDSGVISGYPTAAGIFTGTITASNGIPPDVTKEFSVDTNEYRALAASGSNGNVSGGGTYLLNTTATLTATPSPGYLFVEWTGDATGADNPLSVLMDSVKSMGATLCAELSKALLIR